MLEWRQNSMSSFSSVHFSAPSMYWPNTDVVLPLLINWWTHTTNSTPSLCLRNLRTYANLFEKKNTFFYFFIYSFCNTTIFSSCLLMRKFFSTFFPNLRAKNRFSFEQVSMCNLISSTIISHRHRRHCVFILSN